MSAYVGLAAFLQRYGINASIPPAVRVVPADATTDVLLVTDDGNIVRYECTGACTVTIPNYPEGYAVVMVQRGSAAFTVVGGAGMTVTNRQSQLSSAGVGAQCDVLVDGAGESIFGGDTA